MPKLDIDIYTAAERSHRKTLKEGRMFANNITIVISHGMSAKHPIDQIRQQFRIKIIHDRSPFSLKLTSTQPQNIFFWFHSDSPCLTITIVHLPVILSTLFQLANTDIS